jgi:hypothetical protein
VAFISEPGCDEGPPRPKPVSTAFPWMFRFSAFTFLNIYSNESISMAYWLEDIYYIIFLIIGVFYYAPL